MMGLLYFTGNEVTVSTIRDQEDQLSTLGLVLEYRRVVEYNLHNAGKAGLAQDMIITSSYLPLWRRPALAQRLDLLLNRSLMYPTHTQQIFRQLQ